MTYPDIAFNAAVSRISVAMFSLEMSGDEIEDRVLAEQSGIPSDRIRRGAMGAEAFDEFIVIDRRIAGLPFFVDDTAGLTVAALRTRSRHLKRRQGLGLIIVDHLQLMRPPAQSRTTDNRVREISEITRGLKEVAKELKVPVLALLQLSRAVEGRQDKRPTLADLRESASIEQDADVVMLIYRDEYYLARRDQASLSAREAAILAAAYNLAEVIIAKNRSGPIGEVGLYFDAALTRFGNLQRSASSAESGAGPAGHQPKVYRDDA